jgi:hypothetical protein
VIDDPTLSYRQRVQRLAGLAENALERRPSAPPAARRSTSASCATCSRATPLPPALPAARLRRALRQGSAYLELPPPADLHEALWFLASMYAQVPSITGYPVYLGDLDTVLAPYVEGWSVDAIVAVLRPFWRALDRMLPDAFVHTNLGPTTRPSAAPSCGSSASCCRWCPT